MSGPAAFDDDLAYVLGLIDEKEAWACALDRAGRTEPDEPYVKSDEERAADGHVWALYGEQLRRADREISDRATAGKNALTALHRLSSKQKHGRERFRCFCPHRPKGCRLVTAYAWTGPYESPLRREQTLLLVATNGKNRRATFPGWSLRSERLDPDEWLPVSCKHGTGRFPNGVPGQMINAAYTAQSGVHSRRITDLLGVSDVVWTPRTPMLSR